MTEQNSGPVAVCAGDVRRGRERLFYNVVCVCMDGGDVRSVCRKREDGKLVEVHGGREMCKGGGGGERRGGDI